MSPARVGLMFALVATACFSDKGLNGTAGLSQTGTTDSSDTIAGTTAGTTAGTATTTGTTGPETTTSTTGVDPTSSSSGIGTVSGTTTDPATTDPPGCGGPGEACGNGCCGCLACDMGTNTCLPSDGQCATCHTCDPTGTCVPAPASTPCSTSPDGPCASEVWGLIANTCYARAPGADTCNGDGLCVAAPCDDGPGEEILSCLSATCSRHTGCMPGSSTSDVNFEALCVTNDITDGCQPICGDEGGQSTIEILACDADSDCVKTDEIDCGKFKCSPDEAECIIVCVDPSDCVDGTTCDQISGQCI